MLVPRNIRDFSAIDRQLGDEISPKVGRSLHNQATAGVGIVGLRLRASGEHRARKSKDQKDTVGEVVSGVHGSS